MENFPLALFTCTQQLTRFCGNVGCRVSRASVLLVPLFVKHPEKLPSLLCFSADILDKETDKNRDIPTYTLYY